MHAQAPRATESFVADLTDKRPESGMDPLVYRQIGRVCEAFEAKSTLKRSITSMYALMPFQVGARGERFVADFAIAAASSPPAPGCTSPISSAALAKSATKPKPT